MSTQNYFKVKNGLEVPNQRTLQVTASSLPSISPSLLLDFTTDVLDPRVTFTRASTATYTDKFGVLRTAAANTPRFDYDPVTGKPNGLLIEESRTNLLTYSDQFDNSVWNRLYNSIAANSILSPDGTYSGDKIIASTSPATQNHDQYQNVTVTSQAYTLTLYAKSAGYNYIYVTMTRGAAGGATVYLVDGTISNVSSGTTATAVAVGNGWWKISITRTLSAGLTGVGFYVSTDSSVTPFIGDGTSGIYIWGAQLEAGAFATSYIPTVASQVTRSSEFASMTGTNFSSWYRTDEFSLLVEYKSNVGTGSGTNGGSIVSFGGGGEYVNFYAISTTHDGVYSVTGGTAGSITLGYPRTSAARKMAYAIKANDFSLYCDGTSIGTDTSFSMPNNATSVGFSGSTNNGTIKRIAYYPKRLTNTELQALTQV